MMLKPLGVLILLMVAMLALPQVPKAHAAPPTIKHFAQGSAVDSFVPSVIIPVTVGDSIIAGYSSICGFGTYGNIIDNESNVYIAGGATVTCSSPNFGGIELAHATAKATENLTVTLNSGPFCSGCSVTLFVWDLTPVPIFSDIKVNMCSSYMAGGCSTTSMTAGPTSIISSSLVFGIGTDAASGGTGFTFLSGGAQYGTLADGVANPTNYQMTASTTVWAVAGFVANPDVNEVLVVPCNWFQLQCWLYPMFFFGTYLVLILGIAVKGGVPEKDIKGFALEAFSIGSLIAVMMGMLNVMVPILVVIVQVIRSVRE